MGLSNLTSNMPSMPSAPDASALLGKLQGDLGNAATRANDLVGQMQGMDCPQFNPGMPGADKAKELSQHLNTLEDSAKNFNNPMADELNNMQGALDKVRNSPTPENIKDYQDKAQAAQSKAQQTFSDNQQKASDFASNAEAKANPEDYIAKKRAANAMSEDAAKYQQMADDKSADMKNKANDYEKNPAQQAMDDATEKAKAAQDAANDMQNKIPSAPTVDTPAVSNPYAGLNSTMQGWSLPSCPQISGLRDQLSSAQAAWSNAMTYNPKDVAMQALAGMSLSMSGLTDSAREKAESSVEDVKSAVSGGASSDTEPPSPGILVVTGAKGKCSFATTPFDVIVAPEGSAADSKPMAQPSTVKFVCSGQCMSLSNPKVPPLVAVGSPYPPCEIEIPGTVLKDAWVLATKNTKTANGEPCLASNDIGMCKWAGVLKFTDPGQENATAKAK